MLRTTTAVLNLLALTSAGSWSSSQWHRNGKKIPAPPAPEPIDIVELPLPPVVSSTAVGACSDEVNPHRTGCIGRTTGLQGGNFYPDGKHVLAHINFVGAPASPDSASIYSGQQVIIIKADGSLFPNGDSWKCITCGASTNNSVVAGQTTTDWSYPQAFHDGKRILAGTFIIGCGDQSLIDDSCTPDMVTVNKVRLSNTADDSGSGAMIRELRVHPDNVHIGFSSFGLTTSGSITEVAYYGRLQYNAAPTTGSPTFARYDVVNPNLLFDVSGNTNVYTKGDQIFVNNSAISVGELRGFTGTGNEITYIGYSVEACNIDVFAVNIFTGKVRRLTEHPGYCDPIEFGPDDNWFVIQDTRGSGRTEFMDGLRWLPPLTDLVTSLACSSVRNNGNRRFFQPWLLDRYGDRGDYYGQSLNNAHLGTYGSGAIDDPQWNGQADPWFSPDGTKIVYWQAQAVSPACGGSNPLPCYDSTEPGGRDGRIMLATLTSRRPLPARALPPPFPDVIPWAVQYKAGQTIPERAHPAQGKYTLKGKISGYADVEITENAAKTEVSAVAITLHDYSDHKGGIINGFQNITATTKAITTTNLDWYANITRSGTEQAVQSTSEDGFHMSIDVLTNIFNANGTLTTEVGGTTFRQPLDGA